MDPKDDPGVYLAILRAELELIEKRAQRRRRKDCMRLTDGQQSAMEDIGRIYGAVESLRGLWHKDDERVRLATMYLTRLAWDLREKL